MARLERKTQKIFAEEATNNGVFGSLQAGVRQTTTDIEVIQSSDAYSQGWNAATVSSEKLPPLEEMQGLQYMMTSQIAYQFQEGIPEWDDGTIYYKGSLVKVKTETGIDLYYSKTDNNIGNVPTSSSENWNVWSTSPTITYWE